VTTTQQQDDPVLRLARRRRLRGRAVLILLPVGLLTWAMGATWRDGPPPWPALLSVVALLGAAMAAWWWLERGVGPGLGALVRPRRDDGAFTAEELADARAEHSLRTGSSASHHDRARVEALAARWTRDARATLVGAPLYIALAVGMFLRAAHHDGPYAPAVLWVALAVALLVRSVHRLRLSRRWLREHATAP
jgi:Zn-dependent protease with chaperone function